MQRVLWKTLVATLLVLSPVVGYTRITIDGVLDEPEWRSARLFDTFYTTEPLTLAPAKYDTEARLHSDAEGIYVGFKNYQPPAVRRINRQFARDAFIAADRNIVGIDFDGNGLSGYDFTVGIGNSRQDGIVNNEKDFSDDWDGIWYSRTSQSGDYWYTEIHIPWSVAPMSRARGNYKTMRFYFGRFVWDESLRFASPNASLERPTFLSQWQAVKVRQFQTGSLDWFPYLSGVYDMDDNDEDPEDFKAGIDVVWRPDSATQLTGTLNPDFGQVEADDIVVNFSPFETLFEEQRPFFTENQALFESRVPGGNRLIHTRRIGAGSDSGDTAATDIVGAIKYTHYGQQFDYGAFAVMEDDPGDGDGRDYLATRIQTRMDNLVLGHSLTYVERPTLQREALVNALDADWQPFVGGRARGQLFFSDIRQEANTGNGLEAMNEFDTGGWTQLSYAPGDAHEVNAYILWYGADFDMNDMGFLKRNDWFRTSVQYRRNYNVYPEDSPLLSSNWRIKPQREANRSDNDQLFAGVDFSYHWNFRSTETFVLQAHLEAVKRRDDRITRGNGTVRLAPQNSFSARYSSPKGENFNFSFSYAGKNRGTDRYAHEFKFEPTFFAADAVTFSGKMSYTRFEEWLLWDERIEQLATYETDLYEMALKIDWYPDPRQEVRVKFQWTGVKSDALQSYALAGNGELLGSGTPVGDFSVSDSALQIRYRYKIAPLSDIYLVYSRGGSGGEDSNREDVLGLFNNAWDNPVSEHIQARIRYRF